MRVALEHRSREAIEIGATIFPLSRETFLDLLLCDPGEEPVTYPGTWQPLEDGRWQDVMTGVIHAEGAGRNGGWGDVPVPWVCPPTAPARACAPSP